MGGIADQVTSFVNFATKDGTRYDGDTWVLLGGGGLILLLALFVAYNAFVATVNGIRRTLRVGGRVGTWAADGVGGRIVLTRAAAAPVAEKVSLVKPVPVKAG